MSVLEPRLQRAQELPQEKIIFGPWDGSMRSVTGDQVPPSYIASINSSTPSNNFVFKPRTGGWMLRGGCVQKFDTFGAAVGLLPAKWSSKVRHFEEFKSTRISDGVPTLSALVTKETVASGLDDGWFSNFYLRDQVNGYNYTLGSEYNSSVTYPAIGSLQYFRYTPLWYESGDGGITRGITEFTRRFFLSGSRRFLKAGNWWYHPSVKGTPSRWDGLSTATELAVSGAVSGVRPITTISGGDAAGGVWSAIVAGTGVEWSNSPNLASDCDEGFPADDVTTYIRSNANIAVSFSRVVMGLSSTIPATTGTYTVTYRFTYDTNDTDAGTGWFFTLYRSDGQGEVSPTILIDSGTYTPGTWYTGTTTVTIGASPSIQPASLTCTATAGSATLTSSAQFSALGVGVAISGAGIPAGTTITAVASTSSLTMSNLATATSTTARTFSTTNALGIRHNGTGIRRLLLSAITVGDSAVVAGSNLTETHLIPSGPLPPVHCGSIAATAAVVPIITLPNADDSDGSWVNSAGNGTDLYSYVDDGTTADDTNYITSNASNTTCLIGFATPSTIPVADDTFTLRYRHRNIVVSGSNSFAISIRVGSTTVVSANWIFSTTSAITNSALSLTTAQIAQITAADATWATLNVQLVTANESSTDQERIYNMYFEHTLASATAEGGWKGSHRFFRALYGKFEDGSIHALTTPRFPNDILSSGLDLVTVDSANPDLIYTKITHQNIPILPKGYIEVGIGRSDKIDSSVDDNLLLNPTGIKHIAWVPNGTTSYDDYKADDASLGLDVEQYFIRYDHIMPPRSRYIYGGDMRVCHSYGGTNPCAIIIAPVGRAADWDLNLPSSSASLYSSQGSWMQFGIDTSGVGTLTLIQGDGATATDTKAITLTSTMTLQTLVDTINATSFAVDGQQWRCQLCPPGEIGGIGNAIALTSLTPHNRAIASCVVDDTAKTITVASNALSKVPVGAWIAGTGVTVGAYVTAITSSSSSASVLTYTGTITSATVTLYFYNNLGDAQVTVPATSTLGFQRVLGSVAPGFLYFNKTYLDTQTFDKASTWMTVATPGSVKAAPNCFSGKLSNRFTPPLEAGICQGGAAVDHGFVVLYGNKVGAIRPRGPDSISDAEYGLTIIDDSRGCCAWNTITSGNRFVPFLSAEGMFAADLQRVKLISSDIYVDMPTGLGDFSYEGPQSVAATATDNDLSYAWARVARGILFVGSRTSSSTTHCDQISRLDFTSGDEATGLPALFVKPGQTWGWSTPLIGSGYKWALMCEGRRADGFHLYGWNQENGGSTGDGRIDELETGTTDNGTAITGRVEGPWIRPQDGGLISGQEAVLEHSSPINSTGSFVWHRTFSDDSYTMTPGTSALGVYSELKFFPQGARANANAGYWDYRQATGSARELRKVVVYLKTVKRLKT